MSLPWSQSPKTGYFLATRPISSINYYNWDIPYKYNIICWGTSILSVLDFGLTLYIPVNRYGHVGTVTVSSHNHTFFLGKLDYVVNQYLPSLKCMAMN